MSKPKEIVEVVYDRDAELEKEAEKEVDKFDCVCGSSVSKKNKSSHLKSKKHLDFEAKTSGLDPKLATIIFKMAEQINELTEAMGILLADINADDDDEDDNSLDDIPEESPKLVRQENIVKN